MCDLTFSDLESCALIGIKAGTQLSAVKAGRVNISPPPSLEQDNFKQKVHATHKLHCTVYTLSSVTLATGDKIGQSIWTDLHPVHEIYMYVNAKEAELYGQCFRHHDYNVKNNARL